MKDLIDYNKFAREYLSGNLLSWDNRTKDEQDDMIYAFIQGFLKGEASQLKKQLESI